MPIEARQSGRFDRTVLSCAVPRLAFLAVGGREPPWPHESNLVSPISVALLSFASVCAGALLGLWLHERLPEHNLSKESEGTLML